MRVLMLWSGAAVALAGCGQTEKQGDADAAAANYRPPTVTSRADFGGQIERRFHRLDRNGDDRLQRDELPERLQGLMSRYDKDGDGTLSSDEWGALMLDRFDGLDANRDGSVTSEERQAARARAGNAATAGKGE